MAFAWVDRELGLDAVLEQGLVELARLAWRFVKARWKDMAAKYPASAYRRMWEGIVGLATPNLEKDVHEFFRASRVRAVMNVEPLIATAAGLAGVARSPECAETMRNSAVTSPNSRRNKPSPSKPYVGVAISPRSLMNNSM